MSEQRFTAGDTEQVGDDGKFEAGIHDHEGDTHWRKEPQTWWQRIVAYGETAEEANALRDEILTALSEHKALAAQQPDEPCEVDKRIENAIVYGTSHPEMYATHSEDGREVPEIVAEVSTMGFGKNCAMGIGDPIDKCKAGDKLMTVAQHERILKAKDAELKELRDSMAFRTSLIGRLEAERDELRAALAPAAVVTPEPYGWIAAGNFFTNRAMAIEAAGKTPCIEVYSRPQMLSLNRRAIPEELLERIAGAHWNHFDLADHVEPITELRALLGKEVE